jgi:hypothetical protein
VIQFDGIAVRAVQKPKQGMTKCVIFAPAVGKWADKHKTIQNKLVWFILAPLPRFLFIHLIGGKALFRFAVR